MYLFILTDFVFNAVVGDVEKKKGREGGREGLLELVGVVGCGSQEARWMVVRGPLLEEARRGR